MSQFNERPNRREFFKIAVPTAISAVSLGVLLFSLKNKEVKNKSGASFENQEQAELFQKIKLVVSEYANPRRSLSIEEAQKRLYVLSNNIIEDLQELSVNDDFDVRFNTFFALSILFENETDNDQLVTVLENGMIDKEIEIKMMSALTLLSGGGKSAVPVLIEGLDPKYSEIVMHSHPPMSLPEYAEQSLSFFTHENFQTDQDQWNSWWTDNQDNVVWDSTKRKFVYQ